MRLVICHKSNGSFVSLFYPSADAARAARNRAFREAADRHSKIVTFGPDSFGQDVLIHQECIGSASVVEGDPEPKEAPRSQAKGDGKDKAPMIIPAGAKPEATPIRADEGEKH